MRFLSFILNNCQDFHDIIVPESDYKRDLYFQNSQKLSFSRFLSQQSREKNNFFPSSLRLFAHKLILCTLEKMMENGRHVAVNLIRKIPHRQFARVTT